MHHVSTNRLKTRQHKRRDRSGEPWFVLSEVCRKLEIANASDAASRLDDDEKDIVKIDTLGGAQRLRVVNESGLYSVILRSNKPGMITCSFLSLAVLAVLALRFALKEYDKSLKDIHR